MSIKNKEIVAESLRNQSGINSIELILRDQLRCISSCDQSLTPSSLSGKSLCVSPPSVKVMYGGQYQPCTSTRLGCILFPLYHDQPQFSQGVSWKSFHPAPLFVLAGYPLGSEHSARVLRSHSSKHQRTALELHQFATLYLIRSLLLHLVRVRSSQQAVCRDSRNARDSARIRQHASGNIQSPCYTFSIFSSDKRCRLCVRQYWRPS